MTQYEHFDGHVHPVVGAAARDQIDRHEEEAGSVLSTLKSYLSLYRDPVVARNVADSHFRIKDLMHHDSPVSLYLVTEPVDKERLRPLAGCRGPGRGLVLEHQPSCATPAPPASWPSSIRRRRRWPAPLKKTR